MPKAKTKTLIAIFALAADRVEAMRAEHEKRHDAKLQVLVGRAADGASKVTGRAQDVMFLIGEIAAQGEDCLVQVLNDGKL